MRVQEIPTNCHAYLRYTDNTENAWSAVEIANEPVICIVASDWNVPNFQDDRISHHYLNVLLRNMKLEPRHDKTNKVSVRPAKTQIRLGIRCALSG